MIYTFWFPDPNRVFSLLLLIPIFALRWLAAGRLFTLTPLLPLLLLFFALGVLNVYTAPFSRGNVSLLNPLTRETVSVPWAWVMLGRPLLGMALVLSFVEHVRATHRIEGLVLITLALAGLLALLAVGSTQWNSKAFQLRFLIQLLPVYRSFPGAEGGFNANEIAGAIAWLTPVMAGFALYRWKSLALRFIAALLFWLLMLALFLGQSRLAIGGVVVALALLVFLLIPPGRRRVLAFVGLALFVALEGAIMTNRFAPTRVEQTQERDEVSASRRLEMWMQVAAIVRDHPVTGVGMNMYRDVQVRAVYPVTSYETRVLPHAHNEVLQIAADLGIPGVLVFTGCSIVLGFMLLKTWRSGDSKARFVAVGVAGGLLAHAVYGLGDAVALWDRFAFIFWWLTGIATAQYVLVTRQESQSSSFQMN